MTGARPTAARDGLVTRSRGRPRLWDAPQAIRDALTRVADGCARQRPDPQRAIRDALARVAVSRATGRPHTRGRAHGQPRVVRSPAYARARVRPRGAAGAGSGILAQGFNKDAAVVALGVGFGSSRAMESPVQIERLPETAWARLRAVRLAALRDAPDAFGTTYEACVVWPSARWSTQLRELPTFVAVADGVDVGMVRSAHHGANPAAAYLISMWVAPSARRGVGGALVDVVVRWARALHKTALYLDVREHNHAAISLYERKGFRPTGSVHAEPPPWEHIYEREFVRSLS